MDIKLKNSFIKETKMKPEIIKENILSTMNDCGYKLCVNEGMTLYFNNSNYKKLLISRMESFSRLDDGKFEITTSVNKQIIKFTYSFSVLAETIVMLLLIAAGAIFDLFFFIFAALVLLQFLFRILAVRNSAKNLIWTVLSAK